MPDGDTSDARLARLESRLAELERRVDQLTASEQEAAGMGERSERARRVKQAWVKSRSGSGTPPRDDAGSA